MTHDPADGVPGSAERIGRSFPSPSGVPERARATTLADGRRLAWSEWGPADGAPVLLFHGAPGSSHSCPDTAVTADLGVRLIAPDRPGYGDSDPRPGRTLLDWADDVGALLDHLAIGSAPVVGVSSGAAFALACAIGIRDRVTALALVAGDAPFDDVPGEIEPAELARRRADLPGVRPGLLERARFYAERPTTVLDNAPDGDGTGTDPDGDLRRNPAVKAMLLEMFRHGALHGAEGWVDDSLALCLPWGFAPAEVNCPTTVWYGERDALATDAGSRYFARVIRGARLVVVPDAGHSLPIPHWRAILEDLVSRA